VPQRSVGRSVRPAAPTVATVATRDDARSTGASAVASLRRSFEAKVADLIRRDPAVAANAVEVGLVDRQWLEEPGDRPVRSASTVEMLQRVMERSVEQRPSALSSLGLTALQLLSMDRADAGGEGLPVSLTVVFTDLEGFTRYTAELGDDAAITLLHDHHRTVGPVVRSRGGRVVKRLGDGLMISFPAPEAAVLAACELVGTAPQPLRLRAGVHMGDAVVTHDDLLGHVVNVAARVTEEAKGGQVVVTDEVREATGELPGIRYGRRRRAKLKGVPEVVTISRLQPAAASLG